MSYIIGTEQRPLRVAIVGSGPSAFYAADDLMKTQGMHIEVDMIEKLPTPYGLVRIGVAPDHASIKNVTKIYERIAQRPEFHFWGNVEFGVDVQRSDLLQWFDAIIYAVGAQSDRKMGIPGEDLEGSFSATEFVAWYNGHPEFRDYQFDLKNEAVAVIGMGNVAMDVARILAKTPVELAGTDIAGHALGALAQSRVKDIYLIARRGPVQAAFTPAEARELSELPNTNVIIGEDQLALDPVSNEFLIENAERRVVQNLEIMRMMSETPQVQHNRSIHFLFNRSPVKLLEDTGKVCGIRLVKNELVKENGRIACKPLDEYEEIPVGLVFRSVGYRGVPLPDVPFEQKRGVILNECGRVLDSDTNERRFGEYVVGWAKRGPSGVIGTNKPDSLETAKWVKEDFFEVPTPKTHRTSAQFQEWLDSQNIKYVTFEEWQHLDQEEQIRGKMLGKPRDKITEVGEMLKILHTIP